MALWLPSVDVVASIASLVRSLLAGSAKSPAALEVTERKEVKQQFPGAPDTSGQSLALFAVTCCSATPVCSSPGALFRFRVQESPWVQLCFDSPKVLHICSPYSGHRRSRPADSAYMLVPA